MAPFNAAGRALEGPTTRTRVPRPSSPLPTGPFLPFFGASDPKIFANSGLRPEFGFWASEITGFSLRLAACRRVRYFLVLQVTYAVLTSGGYGLMIWLNGLNGMVNRQWSN